MVKALSRMVWWQALIRMLYVIWLRKYLWYTSKSSKGNPTAKWENGYIEYKVDIKGKGSNHTRRWNGKLL